MTKFLLIIFLCYALLLSIFFLGLRNDLRGIEYKTNQILSAQPSRTITYKPYFLVEITERSKKFCKEFVFCWNTEGYGLTCDKEEPDKSVTIGTILKLCSLE